MNTNQIANETRGIVRGDETQVKAKITLIVERTTPEQKAEIIRLLECKASVNNEVEVDIQPTKETHDTHKPT